MCSLRQPWPPAGLMLAWSGLYSNQMWYGHTTCFPSAIRRKGSAYCCTSRRGRSPDWPTSGPGHGPLHALGRSCCYCWPSSRRPGSRSWLSPVRRATSWTCPITTFYLEFGRLADEGLYPMLHYWTEYPPVIPWLAVAAYKLIAALPTLNGSPIFWFRLAMGTLLLAFRCGKPAADVRAGDGGSYGPSQGLRTAWSYALLFAPLHVWLALVRHRASVLSIALPVLADDG